MNNQYFCKNQLRIKAVRDAVDSGGNPILNGIEYLEVDPSDQSILYAYFIHNLNAAPGDTGVGYILSLDNIIIEGGVRIKKIKIDSIIVNPGNKKRLNISIEAPGDFSTYTLKLVSSSTSDSVPSGYDPQLSDITFSFKINCPSEFDCKSDSSCTEETKNEPKINYLAKDYASFRRLILDRLSFTMPEWTERNVADLQLSLVELLAYKGDYLSYYQDAVATEAYLKTARKRISLKRHARLLDYFVNEGCNARAWIHIEIENGGSMESQVLPAKTPILTKGGDKTIIKKSELQEIIYEENPGIFETLYDINLYSTHNRISFYTWSNTDCCLPAGSVSASLVIESELNLKAGDVLIFEEISSSTSDIDAGLIPSHRHAVRLKKAYNSTDPLTGQALMEIEWFNEDALPFPLCLSATVIDKQGKSKQKEVSVARGNIVLADHGQTHSNDKLQPEIAPQNGAYRPTLPKRNITVASSYDHDKLVKKPASGILLQEPSESLSEVKLQDGDNSWEVNKELMASDRFSNEFVVETASDKTSYIRFGDDIMGKKPRAGFSPKTTYRTGNGTSGNVGYNVLNRIVWDSGGIVKVTNPLPAIGGQDPEEMEQIREFAPQAFSTQKRAVTEDDYAEKTELHKEVQKAVAKFRWTGSWFTVFLTIDRTSGAEIDSEFEEEIRKHLEQYRLAGYDLEINSPKYLPLDIELNICVKKGYFISDIKQTLRESFSSYIKPNGKPGFFHPDNFTFGQDVFLSAIYEKALEIQGIESVEIKKFQVWGKTSNKEKELGMISPSEMEIIRLENDLNFPENGKIEFFIFGGL